MSRNRVIGKGGAIPWRIAEEHRWFRRTTMHGVVIMGRRTFESLPGPLDGRVNVVLTRDPARLLEEARRAGRLRGAVVGPGAPEGPEGPDEVQLAFPGSRTEVRLVRRLGPLARAGLTREHAWLCGGAQVYDRYLPDCSALYLSVVDREVEGDAFFPPFEHLFDLDATVHEAAEFRVLRYVRNAVERRPPLDAAEPGAAPAPRVAPP